MIAARFAPIELRGAAAWTHAYRISAICAFHREVQGNRRGDKFYKEEAVCKLSLPSKRLWVSMDEGPQPEYDFLDEGSTPVAGE
jgi:hypothetical protein